MVGLVVLTAHSNVVHEPPTRPVTMAFATPIPIPPNQESGLFVTVAVHVRSCDEPVDVTAVLGGVKTAYAGLRLPLMSPITVAVTGSTVRDLTLAPGTEQEMFTPHAPRFETAGAQVLQSFEQRVTARDSFAGYPLAVSRGAVIEDWAGAGAFAPVVATMRANWVSPRDASSCFLTLPALVGRRTFGAAAVAERLMGTGPGSSVVDGPLLSAPSDRRTADFASIHVTLAHGHLDTGASNPPPRPNSNNTFDCDYSADDSNRDDAGCSSLAVIVDAGAQGRSETLRDLRGVLLGALVGAIVGVFVSMLLGPFSPRGRRGRPTRG